MEVLVACRNTLFLVYFRLGKGAGKGILYQEEEKEKGKEKEKGVF